MAAFVARLYAPFDARYGVTGTASIPDEEEAAIESSGGHSAYGEITPAAVTSLLERHRPASGDWQFFDLGSGLGKMVVQVWLEDRATLSVGIELSETRHAAAVEALAAVRAALPAGGEPGGQVALLRGDLVADFRPDAAHGAALVYIASLCFEEDFMARIAARLAEEPCVQTVLTLQRFPGEGIPGFVARPFSAAEVTWSARVPVYCYERL